MRLRFKGSVQVGFTLMEMMVTLAIAGLVFFVALPSWEGMLIKSYRAAGRGALLDVLSRQEQYLINNKRYAPDLAGLGLPAAYYVDMQARQVAAARAVYKIELLFDADKYAGVRAIPQHRQRKDSYCMTFGIDLAGVRSVSGSYSSKPYQCW